MENKDKLLSATDAAIYMGITKELLYAYIKNAPKKNKGDSRRLSSILIEGQNYFDKGELDNFDAYLKEPWSDSASQRPPIPTYIKDYLKIEVQGKCPISGIGYPLEDAHISPYCESLNHHHHNIIRISGNVHTKIDRGIISRDILSQTKNNLIQKLKETLKEKAQLKRSTFDVPNPNPFYIGREELIRDLVRAMSDTQLVVIEGIGGIGKSELLIQAINNTVESYNPVVWIDIEQIETFADFLILFSNAVYEYYKVSFSDSGFEVLQNIQTTFVLDSLEKLLINEKDEIEDFITELLSRCPTIQLLITSQIDLSLLDWPLKVFKLQGLNNEESISLIYTTLDENLELEDTEINWILEFSNGHPLTLKLISTLIKYHHSVPRVIQLLKESEKVQHPTRQKHNKSTSLSVCLNTIYDILNKKQKDILHFLKFYPAGMILDFARKKFNDTSFFNDIANLQQFFFIDIKEDILTIERLIIPNPIRSFLKMTIENENKQFDIGIEKEAITEIMLSAVIIDLHYISTGHYGSSSYGIMRLEAEIPNLLFASNTADSRAIQHEKLNNIEIRNSYLNIISGISSAIGQFCFTRNYYKHGIFFAQLGIKAYIELKEYSFASTQYLYLAQMQVRLFDIQGLENTTKKIKTLLDQSEEKVVLINTRWIEGILNLQLKMYSKARDSFSEAKTILEKIIQEFEYDEYDDISVVSRDSDIGNIKLLKSYIAKTYEDENNYSEASSIYKEIIDNLSENFPEGNVASIYHHYAYCLSQTEKKEESVKYYSLAINNFSTTGNFDYLANSISDLGLFIVEEFPEVINNLDLDEDLIIESLKCINTHIVNIPDFLERIINNPDIIPFELIGKIMGIIKALSFSQYSELLCGWVSNILKEIPLNLSKPSSFGAMLNLAHCIGGVNDWRTMPTNKSMMIKSILQCCLIINAGPDLKSKTRIFYWLAKWMQFTKLQPEVTAENLWEQAWNSFDK